jgi:ATP-dependent Clp protease ATP-binding subunit ClpB
LNELSKEILAGKVSKDSDIVLDVFDGKMVFRNRTEKEVLGEN